MHQRQKEAPAKQVFSFADALLIESESNTKCYDVCETDGFWKYNVDYYITDEQGSIRYVLGTDCNVQNYYQYGAFGENIAAEETTPNRLRYNAQISDDLTGLYYLRARYYNPTTGRFTQEDVIYNDGLNLYAYCNSNPVMYCDPSGYVKVDCKKKTGGENDNEIITGIGTSGKGIPMEELPDGVIKDIYPDSNAVFGYSAKPGTAYAKIDFTDYDKVMNKREARIGYLKDTPKIQAKIDEMTNLGKSKHEIASTVTNMRNQSKIVARNKMDPKEVIELEKRNITYYQDPVGPTAEWLFDKELENAKKLGIRLEEDEVWERVIQKSMRKDAVANSLLGIRHK